MVQITNAFLSGPNIHFRINEKSQLFLILMSVKGTLKKKKTLGKGLR